MDISLNIMSNGYELIKLVWLEPSNHETNGYLEFNEPFTEFRVCIDLHFVNLMH